jgi:hypothetical protein
LIIIGRSIPNFANKLRRKKGMSPNKSLEAQIDAMIETDIDQWQEDSQEPLQLDLLIESQED